MPGIVGVGLGEGAAGRGAAGCKTLSRRPPVAGSPRSSAFSSNWPITTWGSPSASALSNARRPSVESIGTMPRARAASCTTLLVPIPPLSQSDQFSATYGRPLARRCQARPSMNALAVA